MAELTQKILKTSSEADQLTLFAEDKIKIENELEQARKKEKTFVLFLHKNQ